MPHRHHCKRCRCADKKARFCKKVAACLAPSQFFLALATPKVIEAEANVPFNIPVEEMVLDKSLDWIKVGEEMEYIGAEPIDLLLNYTFSANLDPAANILQQTSPTLNFTVCISRRQPNGSYITESTLISNKYQLSDFITSASTGGIATLRPGDRLAFKGVVDSRVQMLLQNVLTSASRT